MRKKKNFSKGIGAILGDTITGDEFNQTTSVEDSSSASTPNLHSEKTPTKSKKKVTFLMDRELTRKIKTLSCLKEITQTDLICSAIEAYLDSENADEKMAKFQEI